MIKLWNQTMPHRCVEDAFEPYLTPYDCDAAKTAIVVCPGGAYCGRADYEGNDVGAWLNTIGITAFVLEYRVAPSKAPAQPSDAQRAMRLARKLCMERGIERLGIMGFSAGGHLAATLSVHYDEAFYPPHDELDNLSACPDFTVLCYSVIDMGEYRHDWSRRFLQHRMQAFRQSIRCSTPLHCKNVTCRMSCTSSRLDSTARRWRSMMSPSDSGGSFCANGWSA